MQNAFAETNREVYNSGIDVRFSGSTCVSLLTFGKRIYCNNVGDSRAIMIRANSITDPAPQAIALSRDHKPDDPEESKVILESGGRVDSYRDQQGNQVGPMRAWLKNENLPGLAMSRSFGDSTAARVGVNAVPEVMMFDMTPEDRVLVLASDGVWEFLENQQVANIVYPFYAQRNAEGAGEALVRAAYKRWKKEGENVVDDITCIIVFLDVKKRE